VNYTAVITAGGRVDGAFAQMIGTPVKALAPFAGSTFLHRTIAALREAGIERVAVVGGDEVRRACAAEVDEVVHESENGAENLRRALYAWNGDAPLLYATSDMPFITASAVREFLAATPDGTLALPLTEWPDFDRRFPGAPPFGITLAGEKVVNGGIFAIPSGAASRIETFARRFFDARKSPIGMARLTGPAFLLQFLFKRLSIAKLQAHAERLLGIRACAVRSAPAELAYDVDILEEYRYALEHT
jgi:GTP:adenosylcobinamide-phosphate guanylyltransferase